MPPSGIREITVTPKLVSAMLGHPWLSHVVAVYRYNHMMDDARQEIAVALLRYAERAAKSKSPYAYLLGVCRNALSAGLAPYRDRFGRRLTTADMTGTVDHRDSRAIDALQLIPPEHRDMIETSIYDGVPAAARKAGVCRTTMRKRIARVLTDVRRKNPSLDPAVC